ncbi:hypothetical protein WH47_03757 [Habropoda laboriosa]|uniref:Uncharacterized protein n=1 Tax=Habropoda laboriosa TaxID=597456 RepID=A0A0L7QVW7_9HYME|nr:hypothetical protein WH47_03757 [Habropoda laboriosa]
MSCVHYQSTNPSKERNYFDGQYNRYVHPSYTPGIRTPEAYRSGYPAGWKTLEFQGSNAETSPTAAKGDPAYANVRTQPRRTTSTCKQDTTKNVDTLGVEKLQTRMKFLEDSNIVMQKRNQNLIAENKALVSRLKEEKNEARRLERKASSLREEFDSVRLKLEEATKEAEQDRKKTSTIEATNGTSTTNVVPKTDRGIQIWAVCTACQRKLESCEKQPPTVTITKSELKVLEKDMQALRDTIIAREEAWDKAMEREQNYRQQLTRLTTETVTARHLSETRYEELKTVTNALSEKESEVKSLQKDNLYMNKLIVKLGGTQQRGQEGCQRNSLGVDINEKDQRFIEEAVRRVSSGKCKPKPKSKSSCSERTANLGIYQHSSRDKSVRTARDQTGCLKELKR